VVYSFTGDLFALNAFDYLASCGGLNQSRGLLYGFRSGGRHMLQYIVAIRKRGRGKTREERQ